MPQAFGDIFDARLPDTEKAGEQLFQQQNQRQMMMRREGDMLDATMNRELPKLRGADVPEFTNSYQQYKNLKQQLYFNKDIQRDPVKYNQIQAKANEALSNAYKLADDSTAENQRQKQIALGRKTKPDLFNDNTGEMLNQAAGMTTKELREHPLGNSDSYRYQGSDTDWGKLGTTASGPSKVSYTKSEPVDANGLQTKETAYTFGNTPAAYYQNLVGAMGSHKVSRDARAMAAQIDPQDMEIVHQKFLQIPDEQWQQMGVPRQELPEGNTPEEKFARYKAELYALNNAPKEGKPSVINNQSAILGEKNQEREKLQKNTFKQQQIMASVRNNQAIGRINLHRLYAKEDAAGQDALVDAHFDNQFQEASKGQPLSIPTASGKPLVGFQVNPLSVVAKEFASKDEKGHPVQPDKFILSPDGKTMTGVYLSKGKDGAAIVDDAKTVQKDVNNDLKPVFKNFAVPKSKVPDTGKAAEVPKPKIPVTVHKGMFD